MWAEGCLISELRWINRVLLCLPLLWAELEFYCEKRTNDADEGDVVLHIDSGIPRSITLLMYPSSELSRVRPILRNVLKTKIRVCSGRNYEMVKNRNCWTCSTCNTVCYFFFS